MREIKFKIYFENDEEDGIPFMSEPITLEDLLHEDWTEFENEDGTLSLPLKDFRFFYEKGKNYKILEYTGLKDKNGVEIYEGDIVKVVYKDETEVYHVRYDEDGTCFRMFRRTDYFEEKFLDFTIHEVDLYEVLGNIYDNPELLEKEGN